MKLLWQGSFFRKASLDKVNREMVAQLVQHAAIDLTINAVGSEVPAGLSEPDLAIYGLCNSGNMAGYPAIGSSRFATGSTGYWCRAAR